MATGAAGVISYRASPASESGVTESAPVAPAPVYVVTNRLDMAGALAEIRRARGMTCEQLDAHAGFSDRYTAKLEHGDKPSGRKALHLSAMGEVWIQALGYRLLLAPVEVAEQMRVTA
jgi:hypothetical protein